MLPIFNVLIAVVALALLVCWLTALLNVFSFPRLSAAAARVLDARASAALGRISVCIPMRNEAPGKCRECRRLPGYIRIREDQNAALRCICQLLACPVFSQPTSWQAQPRQYAHARVAGSSSQRCSVRAVS